MDEHAATMVEGGAGKRGMDDGPHRRLPVGDGGAALRGPGVVCASSPTAARRAAVAPTTRWAGTGDEAPRGEKPRSARSSSTWTRRSDASTEARTPSATVLKPARSATDSPCLAARRARAKRSEGRMTRGTEAQEGKTEQAAERKTRHDERALAAPSGL